MESHKYIEEFCNYYQMDKAQRQPGRGVVLISIINLMMLN